MPLPNILRRMRVIFRLLEKAEEAMLLNSFYKSCFTVISKSHKGMRKPQVSIPNAERSKILAKNSVPQESVH